MKFFFFVKQPSDYKIIFLGLSIKIFRGSGRLVCPFLILKRNIESNSFHKKTKRHIALVYQIRNRRIIASISK